MQAIQAAVAVHRPAGAGYRWLELDAPAIAAEARPGQFVHLRVPALEPSALRRPFSICDARDGRIAILYKEVGRGTAAMGALRAGDTADVIGPLGNGFPDAPPSGSVPILLGGGYGVAPLYFLARRLPAPGILMVGARTADDILLRGRFAALGWEERFATADGSFGATGFVTALLDDWSAAHPDTPAALFACGPDGMLRAVGDRAAARSAPTRAWLSLDKRMVCGVGACLACVQRLRSPDGVTRLARVCKDGPVFDSREIDWSTP